MTLADIEAQIKAINNAPYRPHNVVTAPKIQSFLPPGAQPSPSRPSTHELMALMHLGRELREPHSWDVDERGELVLTRQITLEKPVPYFMITLKADHKGEHTIIQTTRPDDWITVVESASSQPSI